MIQIERTADGSQTLFVPELNEHYHSVKGALTESRHIFIDMGLKHSAASSPKILEIGFGTGLNAFLSLLEAERDKRPIHFTTIENRPLDENVIRSLTYPEQISPEHQADYYTLHRAPWNADVRITPCFTLHKILGDFTRHMPEKNFDVVYFDAFAPEKQPEMWTPTLFFQSLPADVPRWNTHYLLRQRKRSPHAPVCGIHCRASARPAGRKKRNVKSSQAGGKLS